MMRKYDIDNLRCGIVVVVILYHIVYLFNSVGVISNVNIQGVPGMDVFLYLCYPWFMVCLFVLAGMSARYALKVRTDRQFLKERVHKILIPSIAGIFIIGWISGFVTSRYADMWGGNGAAVPGIFKYLIYCLSGIGPLWFCHELFLASLVLLLIRKIDKKDRIGILCKRATLPVLFLLVFLVWGSAQILNTPIIEIYRNGIYIFMFLLGYELFSWEEVQKLLEKYALLFLGIAGVLGVVYTGYYWGENYAAMENLKSFLTNSYAWFMTIALIGCGRRWWNKETAFTRYFRPRNFGLYVLHYPLLAVFAWIADKTFHLPPWAFYPALLVAEAVALPACYELVSRTPLLKTLLLGLSWKKKKR